MGETHDLTSNQSVLQQRESYTRDASIILGNGSQIPITNIGHASINCHLCDL